MKKIMQEINQRMGTKSKIVALVCTVAMVVLVYAIVNNPIAKPTIELKKEEFIVEYGNPISRKAEDYIKADKDILKDTTIVVLLADDESYVSVGTYGAIATYKDETLEFSIEVKDTTDPEFIDFKETLEIEKGNKEYDFISQYKAEDLSEVTITVDTSKVKFDEVGDYTIDVSATDKYDNKTTKTATVKVVEPVAAEEDNNTVDTPAQDTGTTDTYVPNNNNNNPVVDNGLTTQPQPQDPTPTTCNANGQWKEVANSGVAFYTWDEANSYGYAHYGDNPEWNGFACIPVKDICGVDGYTVMFY